MMRVMFLQDHEQYKKGKECFIERTLGRKLTENGKCMPYVTWEKEEKLKAQIAEEKKVADKTKKDKEIADKKAKEKKDKDERAELLKEKKLAEKEKATSKNASSRSKSTT